MPNSLESAVRRLLDGRACMAIEWNGPTPALLLQGATLSIASAWRVAGEAAFFGSGIDEPTSQNLEVLVGRRIVGVEIRSPFHDLNVRFEGDWTLDTLADAAEWESWQVTADDGEMLVAGPGDSWSQFPPLGAKVDD